jgi:hypothetical protein
VSIADEGSLSVVVAVGEFQDPDLTSRPILRVHGTTRGYGWSLPLQDALDLLDEKQKELVQKMIERLLVGDWNR